MKHTWVAVSLVGAVACGADPANPAETGPDAGQASEQTTYGSQDSGASTGTTRSESTDRTTTTAVSTATTGGQTSEVSQAAPTSDGGTTTDSTGQSTGTTGQTTDSAPAVTTDTSEETSSNTGASTDSDTTSTGETTGTDTTGEPVYTVQGDRLTPVRLDGGLVGRGGWSFESTPTTAVPDVLKFEYDSEHWVIHTVVTVSDDSQAMIVKEFTDTHEGFRVNNYEGLGFWMCGDADGLGLTAVDETGARHEVTLPAVTDTWQEVRIPWASVVTTAQGQYLTLTRLEFTTSDKSLDAWIQGLQHYDAGTTLTGAVPSGPCPEYEDGLGLD